VQYVFGSDIVWTPFHGKIAVTNGFVVHGEVFFILGATLFRFTNTFRPGINLGGGGRIVLTENVSIRLDVTDNVVIPVGGGATSFTNVMTTTLSLAINFGAPE
jgi:outer membrane beta-barrel protein